MPQGDQILKFALFPGENKPRDAYLASICKASLPPHYTLNVLKVNKEVQANLHYSWQLDFVFCFKATPCTQTVTAFPQIGSLSGGQDGQSMLEADIRHQVVAVGTPLPTSSLPSSAHQGIE